MDVRHSIANMRPLDMYFGAEVRRPRSTWGDKDNMFYKTCAFCLVKVVQLISITDIIEGLKFEPQILHFSTFIVCEFIH
jgi:hypothetical protein